MWVAGGGGGGEGEEGGDEPDLQRFKFSQHGAGSQGRLLGWFPASGQRKDCPLALPRSTHLPTVL